MGIPNGRHPVKTQCDMLMHNGAGLVCMGKRPCGECPIYGVARSSGCDVCVKPDQGASQPVLDAP